MKHRRLRTHQEDTMSIPRALESLKSKQPDMLKLLIELAEQNSGSSNHEGISTVQQVFKQEYLHIADEVKPIVFPTKNVLTMRGETLSLQSPNGLLVRKRVDAKTRILLCGHMDTVFASNHPFQQCEYFDNERKLRGPGVADMKGGLVVMRYALEAFEALNIPKHIGWDVLLTSDEEIGSPGSAQTLESIAKDYAYGLVYEPAMDELGTLAKNRKGLAKLTIIAKGRAAHAGRDFQAGRNAIIHLAKIVQKIHALNGQRTDISLNIGLIEGGSALNVVPDKAVAKIDIRLSQTDDADYVQEAIERILQEHHNPDYSIQLDYDFSRPVKTVCAKTEALFAKVQAAAQELGLNLDWQDSGGCCDGNNLAAAGLCVLDTLGVRGACIHSTNEYMVIDSLYERAALSMLLLYKLNEQNGLL